MSRTITNSDIKKKGNKFHAVADWRDGSEGGTERETFDTFDDATAWIQQLESESDTPAGSGKNTPPVPVPGQDNNPDKRGDLSHSPAAEGHTPNAVPTATDKDTVPEPPASEMNPADAENINSNINLPPSTVAAGDSSITNPDPFGNPLTDGQTAADTQQPSTDHDTSNEVQGVQDANATPSDSSQQSKTTESKTSDAGQDSTTDTSSKSA